MGRRLTDGEAALARRVFGEAIDYDRVRIATGGFGPFAVTLGSRIHVPPGAGSADFSAEPPLRQGFFVHEMTHVWQFQTAALRTLLSWAAVALTGGYGPGLPGYRYRLPLAPWARLNLEQQASAVEHAFLLTTGGRHPATPPGAQLRHYAGALPFDRLAPLA
jgi:hypothetical protein